MSKLLIFGIYDILHGGSLELSRNPKNIKYIGNSIGHAVVVLVSLSSNRCSLGTSTFVWTFWGRDYCDVCIRKDFGKCVTHNSVYRK